MQIRLIYPKWDRAKRRKSATGPRHRPHLPVALPRHPRRRNRRKGRKARRDPDPSQRAGGSPWKIRIKDRGQSQNPVREVRTRNESFPRALLRKANGKRDRDHHHRHRVVQAQVVARTLRARRRREGRVQSQMEGENHQTPLTKGPLQSRNQALGVWKRSGSSPRVQVRKANEKRGLDPRHHLRAVQAQVVARTRKGRGGGERRN